MTRYFWLLALFLLAIPGCHEAHLDVVEGVDLQRFQGQWYEIAKLPRVTQADCTGTTARYEMTSDRELVVTNACRLGSLTGSRRQVVAAARVPNPAVSAKLSVEFGGFFGDYWIIDLDREDYRYAVVGHPARQYLWILSRTPTLDAVHLTPILERATQKGFDVSRLEYTKQVP
jgi:apolipoprotein D and lipocalin family protein